MSIHIEVDQNTAAWSEMRLGVPTASEMKRIVTKTCKLSTARADYIDELLQEWYTGEPYNDFNGEWLEYGKTHEPEALAYYEFHRNTEIAPAGIFFKDSSKTIAASPDGLVGEQGLLEAKCRSLKHYMRAVRKGIPNDDWCQCQSQLWVSEREWCDYLSFFPGLRPLMLRIEPDAEYHAALDKAMPKFIDELMQARESLVEYGAVIDREPVERDHYTQTGGTL